MYEIEVINVWKNFRWYEDRVRSVKASLLSLTRPRRPGREFWSLRDVSLSIARGETVGLIGNNGAGKSTLLRMMSGLMPPTRGRVIRSGRISTIMELGVGFHPDFTGRENVFTGGIIMGLTRREVQEAFPRIVEFAELEQYIDRPVRTYSTGMYMRLAFSLAIHVDPQVLLIDEVLTVGDQSFQRKCVDRIYDIKNQGKSIVLVSHDMHMVKNLCDRVCWLESGRVREKGPTEAVVEAYLAEASGSDRSLSGPALGQSVAGSGSSLVMGVNRWGSLEVEIESIVLRDGQGARRDTFEAGQKVEIELSYRRRSDIPEAIFQVAFLREDGTKCFDVNTWTDGAPIRGLEDKGYLSLAVDRLDLNEGAYKVDVGVYSPDWAQIYDYQWQACAFEVFSRGRREWRMGVAARP